jgi:hypothetical protein
VNLNGAREAFRLTACTEKAGDITGGHVRAAMQYGSRSDPEDTLVMGLLAGGSLEDRSRMDETVCRSGDTFAVPYDECGDAPMQDPDIFNVLVPMERITQIARVNFEYRLISRQLAAVVITALLNGFANSTG